MQLIQIKSIKKIQNTSFRYDIQTKNNNNFFANGILVHNSILKIYWNDFEWIVATNGTINSKNSETRVIGTTFYDLFIDVVGQDGFDAMKDVMTKGYTYLFELVHPISRIVVDYGETKELVFIGMRGGKDVNGDALDILVEDTFEGLSFIRKPIMYGLSRALVDNADELQNLADSYNNSGTEFEGFVVANVQYSDAHSPGIITGRVKVKSPKYLKYHHLAGGSVYNAIMRLILDNEIDEFSSYLDRLPYYVNEIFNETKEKYDVFITEAEAYVAKYKVMSETMTRKDIALDVFANVPGKYRTFIFGVIYSNREIKTMISEKSTRSIREMIGAKEEVNLDV